MTAIWPFRHFGLKLLSLALGLSLWMVVSGEETVERGFRVPLEIQQFPPGLELQGEPPSTVDVRLRGASSTLARVSPGDIVAVLDLRGARVGGRLFHLTSDQVHAPFGVEVVQISPATIAMVFENSKTRSVRIRPAIEGKPAPGYVVGQIAVEPDSVDVVGPESAVNRATEALTEPLSVAGAREAVNGTVTVGLIDPALRLKTTRAARVTVRVVPAPVERTLRALPVHLRNLAANLSAQAVPSVVEVSLRGSHEGLNRLEADEVVAYVDVAGLGSGEYTLTVRAEAPREAGATRIEPATVQVRITSARD
jgi:YbbR domain-containing protein